MPRAGGPASWGNLLKIRDNSAERATVSGHVESLEFWSKPDGSIDTLCSEIPHSIEIDLVFGHSSARLRPTVRCLARWRRYAPFGIGSQVLYRWAREKTNHKKTIVWYSVRPVRAIFSGTGIFLGEILRGTTRGWD